jgi:hypothetical protein
MAAYAELERVHHGRPAAVPPCVRAVASPASSGPGQHEDGSLAVSAARMVTTAPADRANSSTRSAYAIERRKGEGSTMGWSIGFGFGPIRYRASLGGRKRRRKRWHYGQIKVNGKVVWKCEHHHQTESAAITCSQREQRRRGMQPVPAAPAQVKDWHQPPVEGRSPLRQPTTGQAIKAAANRRAKRAATEYRQTAQPGPAQLYPEPAPYAYYRVTAIQFSRDRTLLRMDLVSDSGEPWPGIESPVIALGPQALEIQPGDRFTWDGKSLTNRVPIGLQAKLHQLAAKLNAMPAHKRTTSRQDVHTVQTLREGGYVFNADNYVVPVGHH